MALDTGEIYDQCPGVTKVIEPPHPGRRRRFTAEDKRRLVSEATTTGSSVSLVARRNGISPSLLFRWRRLMQQGGTASLGAYAQVVPPGTKQLQTRVRDLERLLGQKTLEAEMLKEKFEIMRSKKLRLRSKPPVPRDST